MKITSKSIGILSAVAIAITFSAVGAKANTYTFSGNTTYDLGVLPDGNSNFSVTDAAYIPFPVGSNHTTGDSFDFTLATDTLISVTFVSWVIHGARLYEPLFFVFLLCKRHFQCERHSNCWRLRIGGHSPNTITTSGHSIPFL